MLAELPTRAEREPVLRRGEGGDDTTAIDQAAEDAVVARLEASGESFVLVSEELGTRMFGTGGPRVVVVDPIDGSVNAKRDIPFFSFSLAVADGPTMGDVAFGYVHDFGTGEEWTATRGEGAYLNGERLGAVRPKDTIEILSFEGTTATAIAARAASVAEVAGRFRVMGSLALSLCHLAAGRVDAVCSLKEARSVDIAAAQLLVRECDLAVDLFEDPPFAAAPLDLVPRSRLVAAGTPELADAVATSALRLGAGGTLTLVKPDRDAILKALEQVIDPELRRPVTELDMVRDVLVEDDGAVSVTIALTVAGCPLRQSFEDQVARFVGEVPGVTSSGSAST